MPTKTVMIIDHGGLYFILTIKEQFVIWKEKMFPDRRQSWQFLVEAHSSGMRVSSRSTAPHDNPVRRSVRVDCQLASFIIKLYEYQASHNYLAGTEECHPTPSQYYPCSPSLTWAGWSGPPPR